MTSFRLVTNKLGIELSILILLNKASSEKLVLAPGAIFRENTVSGVVALSSMTYLFTYHLINRSSPK